MPTGGSTLHRLSALEASSIFLPHLILFRRRLRSSSPFCCALSPRAPHLVRLYPVRHRVLLFCLSLFHCHRETSSVACVRASTLILLTPVIGMGQEDPATDGNANKVRRVATASLSAASRSAPTPVVSMAAAMMRSMSTASLSKAWPRTPPPPPPVRPESPSSSKHYVAGPSPIPFHKWLHLVIFLICHYFRLRSSPHSPNPHGAGAH
jgi:hypothetical protein